MSRGRIDVETFWLLSSCLEHAVPVALLAEDGYERIINNRGHGLSASGYYKLLERVLVEKLVVAFGKERGHGERRRRLSIADVNAARGEPHPYSVFFRLTRKGASLWERVARPRWDLFVQEDNGIDANGTRFCVLTSASRTWLTCFCDALMYTEAVQPRTVPVTQVARWSPTYWKRLDSGYQLTLRWDDETRIVGPEGLRLKSCGLHALESLRRAWRSLGL